MPALAGTAPAHDGCSKAATFSSWPFVQLAQQAFVSFVVSLFLPSSWAHLSGANWMQSPCFKSHSCCGSQDRKAARGVFLFIPMSAFDFLCALCASVLSFSFDYVKLRIIALAITLRP
jgi:hypothetical protein